MPKILLVEDQSDIATMYSLALNGAGYEVEIAADGRSGMRMVAGEQPDLVLLDIGLPDISGLEVMKAITAATSAERRELPVAILTNYSDVEKQRQAAQMGVLAYLVKTQTRPSGLIQRVRQWEAEGKLQWPADFHWDALRASR